MRLGSLGFVKKTLLQWAPEPIPGPVQVPALQAQERPSLKALREPGDAVVVVVDT